ncbi:MAG: RagB/SusD family nutrient uptake outer membrane protein [Cyclobacteriaceae bacterium]
MNNNIKLIKAKSFLIGSLILFLVSCNDLDKNPLDQISGPTFWNSQADADMALAGAYSRLNSSPFTFQMVYYSVLAGDANQSGISGTGEWNVVASGEIQPSSGLANVAYSSCYQGVSTCNTFLANIDRTPISDATKDVYKGEVLFLRAFFYFRLQEFYGGVPLYTAPVSLEEAKVEQATREQVVAQVLADLNEAIAKLPDESYNGHAVKASAQALKARVLLHQESWAEAAATAKQVMTNGKFSLYNDFKNMFLHYGQENNPEILFSTKYLNPDNSNDQDIQLQWWGILNPRQELVDAFETTDGLPITDPNSIYDPNDWMANRDPRMRLTLKDFDEPAVKASGEVVGYDYNNPSWTGYEPDKFVDVEELPVDYSTFSDHDWILLRYAEVLLNYAEAQNEAAGPDQSVYDAVNEVRARPGIDMPPLPAGLSKEDMRARIRNERRVELALEGLRYSDIKRWKTAEIYIPTLERPNGAFRQFDPSKHYLFPFPQSERDANPSLKQNPNY